MITIIISLVASISIVVSWFIVIIIGVMVWVVAIVISVVSIMIIIVGGSCHSCHHAGYKYEHSEELHLGAGDE